MLSEPLGALYLRHNRRLEHELTAFILSLVALLWGFALWLFLHRNQPARINRRIPLLKRYRNTALHPLFRTRSDVLWFAFWPFVLGLLLLAFLLRH